MVFESETTLLPPTGSRETPATLSGGPVRTLIASVGIYVTTLARACLAAVYMYSFAADPVQSELRLHAAPPHHRLGSLNNTFARGVCY